MESPSNNAFTATTPADIAAGLFPHQVEGVAFLLSRRRAILADDMGLGKTRQAITAMKVEEPAGPYLVLCPASVKRNWVREIDLVLPGASTLILDGGHDGPIRGHEWVVINYDILKKHESRLANVAWRGVILDEAHYVRNAKSQRSRAAQRLVDGAGDVPVYLLTGTPLMSRPRMGDRRREQPGGALGAAPWTSAPPHQGRRPGPSAQAPDLAGGGCAPQGRHEGDPRGPEAAAGGAGDRGARHPHA